MHPQHPYLPPTTPKRNQNATQPKRNAIKTQREQNATRNMQTRNSQTHVLTTMRGRLGIGNPAPSGAWDTIFAFGDVFANARPLHARQRLVT